MLAATRIRICPLAATKKTPRPSQNVSRCTSSCGATPATFGEAWAAWLAGKRKARPSYARSLEQIGGNWLLPVLQDVALDRVNGENCAMVFERIQMFNEEIETAREERRPTVNAMDFSVIGVRDGVLGEA